MNLSLKTPSILLFIWNSCLLTCYDATEEVYWVKVMLGTPSNTQSASQNKDDLVNSTLVRNCNVIFTDCRRMAGSILHSKWCLPGWSSVLWLICIRREAEVGWHSRLICSVQRWSVPCFNRRYAIWNWLLWMKCNYFHFLFVGIWSHMHSNITFPISCSLLRGLCLNMSSRVSIIQVIVLCKNLRRSSSLGVHFSWRVAKREKLVKLIESY